jgi:hypothetical protein
VYEEDILCPTVSSILPGHYTSLIVYHLVHRFPVFWEREANISLAEPDDCRGFTSAVANIVLSSFDLE